MGEILQFRFFLGLGYVNLTMKINHYTRPFAEGQPQIEERVLRKGCLGAAEKKGNLKSMVGCELTAL